MGHHVHHHRKTRLVKTRNKQVKLHSGFDTFMYVLVFFITVGMASSFLATDTDPEVMIKAFASGAKVIAVVWISIKILKFMASCFSNYEVRGFWEDD